MVVEIHEDQVIVEPAVPWIREVWLPLVGDDYFAADWIHPNQVNLNQITRTARNIPIDFTVITSLLLVMTHSWTENVNMTIEINFGSAGELWNVHTQALVLAFPAVINTIIEPDIAPNFAALLANLVAADRIQINLTKGAGQATILYGFIMRYT